MVGDGTPPQLCAMLTGIPEYDLPEARRGFPKSESVDRWPWIFKDFENIGYKTLYSEDDPFVGTFQYRLWGFNKQPTTKYLRPWWIEIQETISHANRYSRACPHQYAIEYLKDFFNVYSDFNKFSMLVFSNLAHGELNSAALIDDDIIDLFADETLKNDTVVIIFGDHGLRTSGFRSTVQGKLEERLPFMSLTLPTWFSQKYSDEFKNIKQNSEVLTSHFDIYATLKHLLNLSSKNINLSSENINVSSKNINLSSKHINITNNKRKYGKSLFTNIVKLNRTCEDAGVERHWCPCLNSYPVLKNDEIIIKVTKKIIEHINNLTRVNNVTLEQCQTLNLKSIIRASKVVPNEEVQRFIETKRNQKCDSCGVNYDKTYNLKSSIYEVVFSVSPSQGEYEASAEYFLSTAKIRVNSDISRINVYGNQPRCIAKEFPHLREFCFCKDYYIT